MGNALLRVQKNLAEVRYTFKHSNQAYSFTQRKGDRIITLFFLTCCINFGIDYKIKKMEDETCTNYTEYLDELRRVEILKGEDEKVKLDKNLFL